MEKLKRIALVAHDNRKSELLEWVEFNYQTLAMNKLICTGTTGRLVEEALVRKLHADRADPGVLDLIKLKSGPLGGDQQLGGMIAEGKIDFVIFFWDPMESQPHDVDVKALLRIAVVYNVPIACNRSTADFMISSPLMNEAYHPILKDFVDYVNRKVV
jgi:methylglyoxal synthase